jgi:histidinol dehydrogenase
VVEVEERRLGALEQHLLAALERVVEQAHRVAHVGLQALPVRGEPGDDVVDVERLLAGLFDHRVLGDRTGPHGGGEVVEVGDLAGAHPDAARLVGVGRADALQRRADLVVAAHRLGDRVVGLVPREDQVGLARHLEPGARDASRFEGVDLVEQGRQVDDDTVRDDRDDVVVQHTARGELEGVPLVVDDDGVPGVVSALVAHDVRVLLREQVDDLGLAFVTPLGADDDGDGHAARSGSSRTGTCRDSTASGFDLSARVPSTRMNVMRRQRWAEMDVAARHDLMARGLDDIFDPELRESIGALIDDVRERGDAAVCDALARFDGIELEPHQLRVTDDELDSARVSDEVDAAIDDAIEHLRAFNERQLARFDDWSFESEPGLTVGEKITPIASAGLFTPSGKASYPSVAYQLAVPAVVAGVPQVALVVPPVPGGAGEVDPAVLVVCRKLGIRDVFRVNGPAGVAALGFGTESIPKVRMVVGPGSPAVTIAQVEMQRYGVATMMLLGPTESLVVADASADPMRLAADLLVEAEHGTDTSVVLVTTDAELADATDAELARQLDDLPAVRATAARAALGPNGGCVLVDTLDEAVEVANRYAPEHLQVAVADHAVDRGGRGAGERRRDPDRPAHAVQRRELRDRVPASLPTSGFAHVSSGITAATFLKRTAVARADARAIGRMAGSVVALADHEGFPAHAAALRRRA